MLMISKAISSSAQIKGLYSYILPPLKYLSLDFARVLHTVLEGNFIFLPKSHLSLVSHFSK